MYLPQTRMTSMLQAAAASCPVLLQRMRWVTRGRFIHILATMTCKKRQYELFFNLGRCTQQSTWLLSSSAKKLPHCSSELQLGIVTQVNVCTQRKWLTRTSYFASNTVWQTTYLWLDKGIRQCCAHVKQQCGMVVVGCVRCALWGVPEKHLVRTPTHVIVVYQCQQRELANIDLE